MQKYLMLVGAFCVFWGIVRSERSLTPYSFLIANIHCDLVSVLYFFFNFMLTAIVVVQQHFNIVFRIFFLLWRWVIFSIAFLHFLKNNIFSTVMVLLLQYQQDMYRGVSRHGLEKMCNLCWWLMHIQLR